MGTQVKGNGKYKARIVILGNQDKNCYEDDELFAPVARIEYVKFLGIRIMMYDFCVFFHPNIFII